jgi:hypothetical protein
MKPVLVRAAALLLAGGCPLAARASEINHVLSDDLLGGVGKLLLTAAGVALTFGFWLGFRHGNRRRLEAVQRAQLPQAND